MKDNTDKDAGDVLTIGELAKYLKMSASYVYKNLDKLPHKKIGTMVRFYRPSVDVWLSHHPVDTRESDIENASTRIFHGHTRKKKVATVLG